ncbi:L-threonylcarbamoyladenylate synthase [Desulfopila sp. IMCC35008]|uniref:L-threonylcarbamoyladenylate synthase n=1 Tax=Desulfopila sp. IMCC35008 TaxID=2653858 RepID=UPI0013D64C8B|nr:L-threonylcarbamoyladenylate synthase [Desulfopila sp. IMCC35008]
MKHSDVSIQMKDDPLRNAVECIARGGIAGIPTETYYGLAVDPENEEALERLFRIKMRPESKPVLVLISCREQLESLVADIPDTYVELMDEFWPGPLTLVFQARAGVSSLLTAGTGTVGIRQTPHPVARAMIESIGKPITATSANISGQPPASSAADVCRMFGKEIDCIVDGGESGEKMPSTVVRPRGDEFCIERHGVVDLRSRFSLCY